MVVAIKFACVAERRILRSENPTSAQTAEGPRNSEGYASLPALRSAHPLRTTQTTSTPLGDISQTRLIDVEPALELFERLRIGKIRT